MSKNLSYGLLSALTLLALVTGCKPKASNEAAASQKVANQKVAPPRGYFETPFQTESQFIVGAIVSDLAEQMYYAANHKLPDNRFFSITAKERRGSPIDAPLYDLQIKLDENHPELKTELNVNGPIWSPETYRDLGALLARSTGLNSRTAANVGDTNLLSQLLDGTPETIERENQALSDALEKDFTNPELHEQAALLLGAFLLRDYSGNFFEIRSPLSRMTAHLVMAETLRGAESSSANGGLAEAILLTLVGDQAPALEQLKMVDTNDTAVASMVRALQARATGDFRPLSQVTERSRVESVTWFVAMADYVAGPIAWQKLDDEQKQTIDFVRAINSLSYSVEMGHQLLEVSIPLELQEVQSVYQLSQHKQLSQDGLATALNELPERCFQGGSGQETHVKVIGWGQWASFLQRHLCHAVQQNFNFMYRQWCVPDEAKKFAAKSDKDFGALRLYPFVRRFNCTDIEGYHKSVDDGFKVTVATPHLVPATCWNYICNPVSFAPEYRPKPNPHVNEWHNHNPPPGTVYDLNPRLHHPSLINRPDAVARFEQLHELAPYDNRITSYIITKKYYKSPTYEEAEALYHNVLPYSLYAVRTLAWLLENQPEQYEKLMLQAAELDPTCYYDLGDHALRCDQEDKAAKYIDKACDADPAAIRVADHADWRVRYYLKKGKTDKAREIADFAGDVYSEVGLAAKAKFLEATTNYVGAFEWFAKIDDRYKDPGPVMGFCQRYKAETGDTRFDSEFEKRMKTVFPKGMEKVSLDSFHSAPVDGAVFRGLTDLMRSAGFERGDVIVAIDGIRTHTTSQYTCVRDMQETAELNLIVWQRNAYREIKANPFNRRFGVDMADYKAN